MKKLLLLIGFVFSLSMNAQYVTTIAGSLESISYGEGLGMVTPKLYLPVGVAVDAAGNLFVGDVGNNRIQKITPAGVVTTFAGSGVGGSADGTGTTAQFFNPKGVAVDAAGNVYVADTWNHRIRKITSAGVVTTLAGSTQGYADGAGTVAKFYTPQGVAVDGVGNVFVADFGNNRIRKITSAGVVTTFAGSDLGYLDGLGTASAFTWPSGVTIDTAGNLFVADTGNNRIRKITAAGVVTTFAGGNVFAGGVYKSYLDGTGTAARFNFPEGVTVDAVGNLFVADTGNRRIRKITAAGVVTTVAGSGGIGFADGTGTTAQFNNPRGVTVDDAGNVVVVDTENSRIRKITAAGVVTTLAVSAQGYANGTGTAAQFNNPIGLAVDAAGNVFVADSGNNRIRKITAAGVVTTVAGSGGAGSADGSGTAAQFNGPIGLAVDAAGNVFVADRNNHRIRKINSAGVVTTLAGSAKGYADGTGTSAQFFGPWGVALDAAGNVYVADLNNNRIRKITAGGVVSTVAGSGGVGYLDGLGTAAQIYNPKGVTVDAAGNLFVSCGDHRIRKITTAGLVTTFAGSGKVGIADGTGTAAQFNYQKGLAVDAAGNVFVADNPRIRKITSAGVVTTLAGGRGLGYLDGPVTEALFYTPSGIAVDGAGNVFVADMGIHRIRKIGGALGIGEFPNTSLKLYPNPTHSLINIQTSNSVVLDKITITDLMGKTVIEQTQNTNQVSVEKLATGVYILNGYSEGSKFQAKFIKE